jgi:hypothetical protein
MASSAATACIGLVIVFEDWLLQFLPVLCAFRFHRLDFCLSAYVLAAEPVALARRAVLAIGTLVSRPDHKDNIIYSFVQYDLVQ